MTTIAFIGLGNMGSPMAQRLLAAGHRVRGFDLSEDAKARLTTAGGASFGSPAEAVSGATVVILMLPNSDVVESVITSPEVTAALAVNTLVIDMGSSEPMRSKDLEQRLRTHNIRFVDAPVSGGVIGAENGTLTVMAGGDEQDLAEAGDVLDVFGTVKRAGQVGAGHAAKALNNLMSATHLLVSSEAILAGQSFGVEPELLLQIVNGSSGKSGSTENKWPNFILPRSYNSGFTLRLMLKDMKIAIDLADQVHAASRLSHAAVKLWEEAAEALPESADHTEIARWVAETSQEPAASHG
ncbi:NAD(P)-dependent oxidoreductase [Arthrobacter ramosus]|uniref:NAD(P)-dependent oxidoreductase n=1 Tax=Arthrobacter ramosus TaxID=1672 RepID=A0ABV5XVV4_ARTRM|nr:NAD(P)-dependent oxidoreductase [Arthrobacter ramosus]